MKLISIGWTAQSEMAHKLAGYRPAAPELYAGQHQTAGQQIADVCAALNHPETDAAVLVFGPRAEVFAALEPLRRQIEAERRNPA